MKNILHISISINIKIKQNFSRRQPFIAVNQCNKFLSTYYYLRFVIRSTAFRDYGNLYYSNVRRELCMAAQTRTMFYNITDVHFNECDSKRNVGYRIMQLCLLRAWRK